MPELPHQARSHTARRKPESKVITPRADGMEPHRARFAFPPFINEPRLTNLKIEYHKGTAPKVSVSIFLLEIVKCIS